MRSLRQRLSDHLLRSGAEMAFDHEEIRRGIARAGRGYDADLAAQAVFLVHVLSRIKLRLGLLLLPAAPPVRRPR